MEDDLRFPVCEGTVAGVGSGRNVQLRMILEGEEPREVGRQGTVGAAESPVRVPPLPFVPRIERAFFEEVSPSAMPLLQLPCKLPACGCREREDDRSQFLPGLELRPCREVVRDREKLVEVAELEGNLGVPLQKQLPDTSPPINSEGTKTEPRYFETLKTTCVVLHLFRLNLLPVHVLPVRPAHEEAVHPLEEGGIHDEVHRLLARLHLSGDRLVMIEVLPERLRILPVPSAQLRVRLLARHVLFVGAGNPRRFRPVPPQKLPPATEATVLLPTPRMAVPFDLPRATEDALFLGIEIWGKDCVSP